MEMKRKPRIALLGAFPVWLKEKDIPAPGGHYAVWLVALHEAFKAVDTYDLHWVLFCKGVKRYRMVQHANQTFHILPAGSLELASRTGYIWDRWRVKRLLARLQPDIVHAWGTENRYAACAAVFPGKKILSMQGVLTACQRLCPQSGFMRRQAAAEPRLLPLFDVVTAESEWACARCREIAPNSRILRWEYAAEERFFRVVHHLADTPTCLMAGTDTPIKNVDTAIKAFSDAQLAHVKLLLAGVSPAQRPNLPPNICALGRVSRERMTELLAGSWVLVHPSLVDSSPNIIKEARVVGLPVVTTTDCGGAQYVDEGKSGFVVEARDTAALQQAVLHIVSSAQRAEQMGAWRQAECRYLLSRETMLQRLMHLYEAVLQGKEGEPT